MARGRWVNKNGLLQVKADSLVSPPLGLEQVQDPLSRILLRGTSFEELRGETLAIFWSSSSHGLSIRKVVLVIESLSFRTHNNIDLSPFYFLRVTTRLKRCLSTIPRAMSSLGPGDSGETLIRDSGLGGWPFVRPSSLRPIVVPGPSSKTRDRYLSI